MRWFTFSTPLGPCAIGAVAAQITGFRLPGPLPPSADDTELPEWLARVRARVQGHLGGQLEDFADLPYDWTQVSPFQRAVYEAALTVKAGATASYGQLAARLGQPPGASRAIGVALAQNPWPLLVPCHRFVGADGRMTGFSAPGGIETKLRLLALEGAEWFTGV